MNLRHSHRNIIRDFRQVFNKRIKKIAVEGANNNGSLKIDTDSIHMKHSIKVETSQPTNEVNTTDFFDKVSAFVKEVEV